LLEKNSYFSYNISNLSTFQCQKFHAEIKVKLLQKQTFNIFPLHSFERVVGIDKSFGHARLVFLKFQNLFFYCLSSNEAVNKHFLVLPDTMSTTDGLIFGSGVPPRVDDKNIIGRGKVKSNPSGLQANEENIIFCIALKT